MDPEGVAAMRSSKKLRIKIEIYLSETCLDACLIHISCRSRPYSVQSRIIQSTARLSSPPTRIIPLYRTNASTVIRL